jgi:hypothetical protein
MQIVLEVHNSAEMQMLLEYIRELTSVKILPEGAGKAKKRKSAKILKMHQTIIAQGGNASYFGDAADWQRQERQERNLPFPVL